MAEHRSDAKRRVLQRTRSLSLKLREGLKTFCGFELSRSAGIGQSARPVHELSITMRKFWLPALLLIWLGFAISPVLRSQDSPKPAADAPAAPAIPPELTGPETTPPAPKVTLPQVGPVPPTETGLGPQTSVPPVEPLDIFPEALNGIGPSVSVPPPPRPNVKIPKRNWIDQTPEDARRKSAGCMDCHKTTDAHTMHDSPNVVLGCTDCHGGNRGARSRHSRRARAPAESGVLGNVGESAELDDAAQSRVAGVHPLRQSRRPARGGAGVRALPRRHRRNACGNSMMNHGAMLWNAAAYNNGAINLQEPDRRPGLRRGWHVRCDLNNPFKPTAGGDAQAAAFFRRSFRCHASIAASRAMSSASSRKAAC